MSGRVRQAAARALADPLAVIVETVAGLEPDLDPAVIGATAEQVASSRHKRRRLAVAITSDPAMLTDGRSTSPLAVGQLLGALLARGATSLAAPRCAACDRPRQLVHRRGEEGLCTRCYRRQVGTVCSGCGTHALVAARDRHGQPRCLACPIDDEQDPMAAIVAIVARLEPALDAVAVIAAVRRAAPQAAKQRRLAWALADHPELLTGAGASAPPAALRLIQELCAAGATSVHRPACPGCQRVVALPANRQGRRVCAACAARARVQPCASCGAVRRVTARDAAGRPRCAACWRRDPATHEACTGCGQHRAVVRRTTQGPLCRRCWRGPTAVCTRCGRRVACVGTRAGAPRCERCARPQEPCKHCGRVRPVAVRCADGPWCTGCHRARLRRCQGCGVQERLFAEGRCARCVLDRRARALLGGADGTIRPELTRAHQTLAATRPARAGLKWLRTPSVQTVLGRLASGARPLTHATLDELAPGGSVEHLRSVLVASGCLPDRDEQLARLERWIEQAIAQITRPDQQRLVRSFAVWHLLRRLRRRVGDGTVTNTQAHGLRGQIRAAISLLAWLDAHNHTLATCRQADLDRWRVAGNTSDRHAAYDFLRWALAHRLAHDLKVPTHTWTGPAQAINSDTRWTVARQLLTDTTLDPADRLAGLLVLLYAQPVSVIATLTLDRVSSQQAGVSLRLGHAPILLPAPLDELVLDLVAARKGHATVGHSDATPWLFPGGRPGRPIGAHQLMMRLHRLGIRARPARAAALLQLATELPPIVLARLLGLHPNVAAAWQRLSGGQWTTYAAEFSRRDPTATTARQTPQPR